MRRPRGPINLAIFILSAVLLLITVSLFLVLGGFNYQYIVFETGPRFLLYSQCVIAAWYFTISALGLASGFTGSKKMRGIVMMGSIFGAVAALVLAGVCTAAVADSWFDNQIIFRDVAMAVAKHCGFIEKLKEPTELYGLAKELTSAVGSTSTGFSRLPHAMVAIHVLSLLVMVVLAALKCCDKRVSAADVPQDSHSSAQVVGVSPPALSSIPYPIGLNTPPHSPAVHYYYQQGSRPLLP